MKCSKVSLNWGYSVVPTIRLTFASLSLGLLWNIPVWSEPIKSEEVLVTAERLPVTLKRSSTSVTLITQEDIQRSGAQSVSDLLRGEVGVDVVQSGGLGGNAAVFLRGANSEHTLVIVDGVPANDPISPTRTFDFANFNIDNIDRIEILRGPQSVSYGSDALGGVIKIYTKRGCGAPSGSVSAEGGSFGTFIERGDVSGGDESFAYSVGVSRLDTDGFSAADKKDGNSEKDGREATSFSSLVETNPTDEFSAKAIVRYSNARNELDNFGGSFGDDPNRVLFDNQLLLRGESSIKSIPSVLSHTLGVSFTDQWYSDDNGIDASHTLDSLESNYTGKGAQFDLQNDVTVAKDLVLALGFVNLTEMGSSSYISESSFGPYTDILNDVSVTSNGYYLNSRYDVIDNMSLSVGGRVDDHSKFGTTETWKAGSVLNLESTKFSGSVGTGYKAPSIFQLYSTYGDQSLKEEESFGWDLGIEQEVIKGQLKIGATYFDNDFDNLISFNPETFKSENIAEASSRGIESFIAFSPDKQMSVDIGYTWSDTEDKSTGLPLLRRARNKAKIRGTYKPIDKMRVSLELLGQGKRADNDFSAFPTARTDLAGYVTCNVGISYEVQENVELYARLENIFDKNYQEVLGYGTSGAAAYGGVRYNF